MQQRILVLGVGNILFTDEGVGVRTVERLMEDYEFSDNVTMMDGGTLGTRLMEYIMDCDLLIVVDAVLGDSDPGATYRLTGEDLRRSLSFKNSMHQTDLVDTLLYCEMIGNRPEAIVVGIEPEDYQTMAVEISETSKKNMPRIMEAVLKEVEAAGGSYKPRATEEANQG